MVSTWPRPLLTADSSIVRPNHTRPGTVPFVRSCCRVKSFFPVPRPPVQTVDTDGRPPTRTTCRHVLTAADVTSRHRRNGRLAKAAERPDVPDMPLCQRFRSLKAETFFFPTIGRGRTEQTSNASTTDPNQTNRGSTPHHTQTTGIEHLRQDL